MSFKLHALTARMDREADRILVAEQGISYARFLSLFMVSEFGPLTQRGLAERLGVTEPSVSRMTASLTAEGLLAADPDPAGGNRKQLVLTKAGRTLVRGCASLLEARVQSLVADAEIPFDTYLAHTDALLRALTASPTGANGANSA
ncbi:MAG: MarR family transcriptional regulator [bacterium]|nr:MarR family transcriptional regulator [bacterium]